MDSITYERPDSSPQYFDGSTVERIMELAGDLTPITEIAALMREDLKHYPELKKYLVNVGGMRGGGMSGQNTINYEIYGYDFEKTDSVAQQLKRILEKVPGAADINISRSDYQPEYHVDFDREKLAIYGLNLSTAASALPYRPATE